LGGAVQILKTVFYQFMLEVSWQDQILFELSFSGLSFEYYTGNEVMDFEESSRELTNDRS